MIPHAVPHQAVENTSSHVLHVDHASPLANENASRCVCVCFTYLTSCHTFGKDDAFG